VNGLTTGLMTETNTLAYQRDGKASLSEGKDKETTAAAPEQKRWGFFATGSGLFGDIDADKSAGRLSDADFTSWGVLGGADVKIGDHVVVGAYGEYTHTWADLDNQGSNADIDSYGGGLYLGWHGSPPYMNAMFNVSKNTYDSNRTVALIGLPDPVVHGSTDGLQIGGDISGGYDFYIGDNFTIGPFVGLQYVHFDVNDFDEVGPVPTGLRVGDEMDSLRSRMGGKFDYHRMCHRVALDFQARAAWQHEYLDDGHNITGSFFGGGGPSFIVPTTIHGRNAALCGVGANVTVWNMLSFFADYDVQAGQSDYLVQSAKGGLRIDF